MGKSLADAVILITREGIGCADPVLEKKLFGTYLKLLLEHDPLPAMLCFYTDGVKLLVEDSPFLEQLSQLEQRGVRLISCSTCINDFELGDKARVGIIGGMPNILEAQTRASKVITR